MCGADDCPACHPENFKHDHYIDDAEPETHDSDNFADTPITPFDPND